MIENETGLHFDYPDDNSIICTTYCNRRFAELRRNNEWVCAHPHALDLDNYLVGYKILTVNELRICGMSIKDDITSE